MKTNTITLSAAFLAIASEHVLINPLTSESLASDGEVIAAIPLPEGFIHARAITKSVNDLVIGPDDGDAVEEQFQMSAVREMAGSPAYRIAFNPAKLAALAAALGAGESVIVEFPDSPEKPIHILPNDANAQPADGYIMPEASFTGIDGLLGAVRPAADLSEIQTVKRKPQAPAALPPPVIITSEQRNTVEVNFGGRPDKAITEAIGRRGLGFSYSGERGTKKGVPPRTWYAPNNEFFRTEVAKLLKVTVSAAA